MAQMKPKVLLDYEKPRVIISYNEQKEKYYGMLEDEKRPEGAIQFDLTAALLLELKACMNAHPDIEVG